MPAEEVVEEIIDQNPTQTEEQKDQPQEQVSAVRFEFDLEEPALYEIISVM